jgi:outer membrane lipoprotein-sorting protein
MKDKTKALTAMATACLMLEAWALYVVSASPARWRPSMIVRDEPVAHTLYEVMLQTMQEAQSLSFVSTCGGPDKRSTTYRVWLKKANALRMEVNNNPFGKLTTLVCDGNSLWIYWEGNRPFLRVDDANSYEKTRSNVYVKRPARPGEVSVTNEIAALGIAWYNAILDPSLFHGLPDVLEASIDGVRARGKDRVGDEECEVIEASYEKARRVRYYWVSKKDCLPRKVKEVTRLAEARVFVEEWSDVSINPELPQQRFTWFPPEGWREWELICTRDPNAY